tara:strand:- start:304 stop:2490 length:2187 start_codon:yes stop_codon:yes gene_type:complete
MKKFFFVALFVLTSAYSQYSNVTVYDEYGNNLGSYQVESDYAYNYTYGNSSQQIGQAIGNEIRMAMSDYIAYLQQRDDNERKERDLALLRQRAAKIGISIPSYALGDIGAAAFEGYVGAMEAAERRKARERAEREYQAKRDAEIKRAVKSDVMNAYDYAKNIPLEYKKEMGIKKGSGYFKLPTMLFKSQGKGKFVRQEGNVQMIYNFYWPGERNKDFASQFKGYENFSNSKMNSGETWGTVKITRKTIYRNSGIAATVEWEDEYEQGVRTYYGAEDSNGIDYYVKIESRSNKSEASIEQARRVFNNYKPLLEKCIANSRVDVKKLMNEKFVLDSKKSKNKNTNASLNANKKSAKNEVLRLVNSTLEKDYFISDRKGAIENINRALDLYKKNMSYNDSLYLPHPRTKLGIRVSGNSNIERLYEYRSNLYWRNGEYDKALEDYNTIIEMNPESVWALHQRGKHFYGESYRAISDFSKAYESSIKQTKKDMYHDNISAADIKYRLGDVKNAISGYIKSLETSPIRALAKLRKAYIKQKNNELLEDIEKRMFEVSVKELNLEDQELLLFPLTAPSEHYDDPRVLDSYIEVRFKYIMNPQDGIDLDELIENTIKVLELIDNHNGWTYNNQTNNNYLFYLLYKTKGEISIDDPYEAIPNFNKALEYRPEDVDLFIYNAGSKIKVGDTIGACNDIKKLKMLSLDSIPQFNRSSKLFRNSEELKTGINTFLEKFCN